MSELIDIALELLRSMVYLAKMSYVITAILIGLSTSVLLLRTENDADIEATWRHKLSLVIAAAIYGPPFVLVAAGIASLLALSIALPIVAAFTVFYTAKKYFELRETMLSRLDEVNSIDVNNSILLGIFLPGPPVRYNVGFEVDVDDENFEVPEISEKNYQRCEALGIPDDAIPQKFLDGLNNAIMDNPVMDPKHPQVRYEDSVIRAWLARSQTNPFTRQRLLPDSLQKDEALQQEIEAWLDEQQRRPRLS